MSCEDVERDLDAYLDRELDVESAKTIRDHMSECGACRRQRAERQALSRLVRAAPYYSAPERVRERVFSQSARPRAVRRTVTWAAAAVIVLSVGVGLVRSSLTQRDEIADQ